MALVLFTLGSMFALYEGIEKLIDPHELESPIWAFGVLGVAIVLEGWSLRTAHHEATPSRGGRSWWRFIRTTKSPELPVVLLEDTGRARRSALRAHRDQPGRDHGQPRGGTRSAASGSVCCSASSP